MISEYEHCLTGYECPDCDWDPPQEGFYYIDGTDALDCTRSKGDKLIAKPPKGKKAYPVYENSTYVSWAAMEFGGNPRSWDETHCCPECGKEFTFSNSNY